MDLSIIIVNWNTKDLLLGCLKSVFETVQNLTYEVIVLDNASSDDSPQAVKKAFPQVKIIESQTNLGFAGGNNLALEEASGAAILLLNPDTLVLAGAINTLYEVLGDYPALGAVGAQLLNPDRSNQPSWGMFPSLWLELPIIRRIFAHRQQLTLLNSSKCASPVWSVDWASGASLMIRRETWNQVGRLDEDYWLYTEEVDWCYRARRRGWCIGIASEAYVVHIQQAGSVQRLANSLVVFSRSRAMFLQKHRSHLSVRGLWLLYAVKASIYVLLPKYSPLGRSGKVLDSTDVTNAYKTLHKECMMQMLGKNVARY